jgi:hypothetical protein
MLAGLGTTLTVSVEAVFPSAESRAWKINGPAVSLEIAIRTVGFVSVSLKVTTTIESSLYVGPLGAADATAGTAMRMETANVQALRRPTDIGTGNLPHRALAPFEHRRVTWDIDIAASLARLGPDRSAPTNASRRR